MYGTAGSSTYAETHKNTNSSTIKTAIDTWYSANLSTYSSYLVDIGFCGDRSLSSGTGIGTTEAYYSANDRLNKNNKPQFKCPQTNDLYTTATSTKGNKALTYPIGLITADEVVYAGGVIGIDNSNYYLYNIGPNWTMTPINFFSFARSGINYLSGRLVINSVFGKYEVHPVINLNSDAVIIKGNGSINNPYVIKTN